jgi:hypothetical protein
MNEATVDIARQGAVATPIDYTDLVLLKDIDSLMHLPPGRAYALCKMGVFHAFKMSNTWYVKERYLAEAITRITKYRQHEPFHPEQNVSAQDAARRLGVSLNQIYHLLKKGELDEPKNEMWKCVTIESLKKALSIRGRQWQ